MSYIPRTMEPLINSLAKEYAAILITGPRQVGKSTMLTHVLQTRAESIEMVTLDNLTDRQLAIEDPALFFQIHPAPVLVDEA